MAFPLDDKSWQMHHAAPFSVVQWTNIYDPARFIFLGDVISGPLAPHFGQAITDINLRQLRGAREEDYYTLYHWDLTGKRISPAIIALRKALNLAGNQPPV